MLPSNELQIERGVQAVMDKGNRKIGILGISFKAGTDDLRESPMVELTERLIGKGYDVQRLRPQREPRLPSTARTATTS